MATQLKETSGYSVKPLHPCIGAEVSGIDLTQELSADTIAWIRQAWADHTLLLFRGQDISDDDQLRLCAEFGPIATRVIPPPGTPMPKGPEWTNIMMITDHKDENGDAMGALGHGDMWFHSDKCYREKPHRVSFLYGIEIPSEGGHTKFASLYAAYENMPDSWKERFAETFVMQGYDYGNTRRVNLEIDLDDILHFRQPMIITNPDSGRKSLYVARLNTMWVEGMERGESEEILNALFDLTEDESVYYEHVWQEGDLLMWDNLACLHARTDWPDGETRTLRRCTAEGERLWHE
jgi:taurine dioxygenase